MAAGGDSLEQFKNRLPLADIIGRYVKLTRKGREYQGLCPFHQEKTPSFSVVEEKGFYHCFGCGAHGDAISFITAIEGLSFPDALQRLGDITGIEPPRRTEQAPKADPGLFDANAAAARYFQSVLASEDGRAARHYLQKRGVSTEAIESFGIGVASSQRAALKAWLAERGIGDELAVNAGLLIRPEDGSQTFDRFRDRLMIPIEDGRGRIVGFGGRALADQKAKYLNSPETEIFQKGELLYNLKKASVPARQAKRLMVVEGYMDVIALSDGGMPEAVAPLGTAVTEAQLQLLWRGHPAPIVCLDGDRAGRAAALRLARRALPVMKAGQSLEFISMPDGEDPDSLIRHKGQEAIQGLIRTAMPLSRLIWQEELQAHPPETPEAYAHLRIRLMSYVDETADYGLKQALKDQFYSLLNARRPASPKFRKRGRTPGQSRQARAWEGSGSGRLAATLLDPQAIRDARLLGYFLREPSLLHRYAEDLAAMTLQSGEAETARQEVLAWYARQQSLDAEDLRHHLTRYGCDRTISLALDGISMIVGDQDDLEQEVEQLFGALRDVAAKDRGRTEWASGIAGEADEDADAKRRAADQLINPNSGDAA